VLLLRAKKKTDKASVPHLGLAMLASVLQQNGHQVMILDYLLFLDREEPSIEDVINRFDPDVIGLSLYTSTMHDSSLLLDEIGQISDKPVIVGGPHATLYAEDLAQDRRIDYIFMGEAELSIVEVVEKAQKELEPVIIECPKPNPAELPFPDFTVFLNYESISQYPLTTSRGCPYRCKFCAVHLVSTAKWRSRDPEVCVNELEAAKKNLPRLQSVKIVDDCPTLNMPRFKKFLHEYIGRNINVSLWVDNFRADRVDQELVWLLKQAGCTLLCIAVEHGNPEVFEFINKGETLDDIRKAARLIKEEGLELGLCFVIGLPKDTYRKMDESIRLAKELKPALVFWNMAHPMKGTEIRKWFEENNARIGDDQAYTSYAFHTVRCLEPVVETADFSSIERKKAYFKAVVETDQYEFTSVEIGYLMEDALKYRLGWVALKSLLRRTGKGLWRKSKSLV
jgi:radical SAM superfamily enzyme YgiQ (UPF0313 family)